MGDMNYRVDLDTGHVRDLATVGKYSDILAQCQMNKVMQQPDSPFAGFSEAPIRFAPSYSYDVGTDSFDSSPKRRIPSYCDRWHRHDVAFPVPHPPPLSPQDPMALQRQSRQLLHHVQLQLLRHVAPERL